MCEAADLSSKLIVYNNTLQQYLGTASSEFNIQSQTMTYHTWFGKWYYHHFRKYAPQIEPYVHDWQKIHEKISKIKRFEKYDQIIIDEGQDLPKDFYLVMCQLSDNVTVFADENQRLHNHNSSISDIKKKLGVQSIHKLTKNYRNTKQIAEFAACFYAGLQTEIPELPNRNGQKPRIFLNKDFEWQMKLIAVAANNNPEEYTGVFFRTNDEQRNALRYLQNKVRVPVQVYIGNDDRYKNLDFCKPGIYILAYPSAKGLEFDRVFMPSMQNQRTDADELIEKMEFYVLFSRARENLIILTERDSVPRLIKNNVPEQYYMVYQ